MLSGLSACRPQVALAFTSRGPRRVARTHFSEGVVWGIPARCGCLCSARPVSRLLVATCSHPATRAYRGSCMAALSEVEREPFSAPSASPAPPLSAAHSGFLSRAYFPLLDGLRCLSIIAVVWHHAAGGSYASGILSRGYEGVSLFFVISGFLITTLLLR